MQRFVERDRVRVDIPDEGDPDHTLLHGQRGEVIEVAHDDAGAETGDERDGFFYRVKVDTGEEVDLRWRDLRST